MSTGPFVHKSTPKVVIWGDSALEVFELGRTRGTVSFKQFWFEPLFLPHSVHIPPPWFIPVPLHRSPKYLRPRRPRCPWHRWSSPPGEALVPCCHVPRGRRRPRRDFIPQIRGLGCRDVRCLAPQCPGSEVSLEAMAVCLWSSGYFAHSTLLRKSRLKTLARLSQLNEHKAKCHQF